MERKLIEWTLDDVMGELRRISLVSDPAVEEEFILFNSTELKFQTVSEEERIVSGVCMIPDVKIPRKDENGELYYGFFSKETVKKAAQLFFKKGSNTNLTNLEHEFEVDGIYFFESWLVSDPNMDKSKTLGFNVPSGTWMVSAKIDNEVVWDNYIKTGLIKGFSVEVKANETEVEILSQINDLLESDISLEMKWKTLLELIK
jgi:hypothetical protein